MEGDKFSEVWGRISAGKLHSLTEGLGWVGNLLEEYELPGPCSLWAQSLVAVLLGYRKGHSKGYFKVGYPITSQDLKVYGLDLKAWSGGSQALSELKLRSLGTQPYSGLLYLYLQYYVFMEALLLSGSPIALSVVLDNGKLVIWLMISNHVQKAQPPIIVNLTTLYYMGKQVLELDTSS